MIPGSGASVPSASAGHHVGAEVDGEDLHDREGQRDVEQHEQDERHELGHIAGEDVGHEPADVVVDRATLFDRVDDAREVVVGEDHVGRLFGDVRAGDAHRDADVGRLQRRRVVHAVAGHRHDMPHALEGLGDLHLVLGRDPREEDVLGRKRLFEPLVGHVVEFVAGDDPGLLALDDADAAGDRLGGQTVVAGDHDDLDAGGVALFDRDGDLVSRRVHHRHEPDEHEVALGVRRRVVVLVLADGAVRHGEHAKAVARELVVLRDRLLAHVLGQNGVAVDRRDPRAQLEHFLRRALHVADAPELVVHVDGRHALAHRVERQLEHAPRLVELGLVVEARLLRGDQQRGLSRIAEDRPCVVGGRPAESAARCCRARRRA